MRHTINIRPTALLDAPFGAYEQHLLCHYALAMFLPEKEKARLPIEDTLIDWYKANRAMLAFRVAPLDAVLRDGRKARDYSGQFMLRYAGKLPAIMPLRLHPRRFRSVSTGPLRRWASALMKPGFWGRWCA